MTFLFSLSPLKLTFMAIQIIIIIIKMIFLALSGVLLFSIPVYYKLFFSFVKIFMKKEM